MRKLILLIGLRLALCLLRGVYVVVKVFVRPRYRVLMVSREQDTIPLDFALLRDELHRIDPTLEVVVLVRAIGSGVWAKLGYGFYLLRQLAQVAAARVLILDTYSIVASTLRHRPELRIVQIWHALGAFKKFGYSVLGSAEGSDLDISRVMAMHRGYHEVWVSGPSCRSAYAEAFDTPVERVRVLPLPRVDVMIDPERYRMVREQVLAMHPELGDGSTVLFAPTFRKHSDPPVDLAELERELAAAGLRLVVKMHPLTSLTGVPASLQRYQEFTTQELMTVADAFVTDYSSAVFEAALLGIPLYFLAPDLDRYTADRDFYFDYRSTMPGPVASDSRELVRAIAARGSSPEKVTAFAHAYIEVPEGRSATESMARRILGLSSG